MELWWRAPELPTSPAVLQVPTCGTGFATEGELPLSREHNRISVKNVEKLFTAPELLTFQVVLQGVLTCG